MRRKTKHAAAAQSAQPERDTTIRQTTMPLLVDVHLDQHGNPYVKKPARLPRLIGLGSCNGGGHRYIGVPPNKTEAVIFEEGEPLQKTFLKLSYCGIVGPIPQQADLAENIDHVAAVST